VKSSQVRELARRYATGQLNQENYRSQRRTLIDAVTGGQQALAYKESGNAVTIRRAGIKFLALGVVAALMAGVVISMLLKSGDSSRHPAVRQAAAAQVPALPPAPGPGLVHTFVDADDWTDSSLESFTRRWSALPADEQAKARASLMFPRLVSDLRQQITSEKAVAAGGADLHLAALQKMAKTLGVTGAP
jgi:hypothetical protein